MAKGADFGGLAKDDFDALITMFAGTVRPASTSDAVWITELEEKVKVLKALAEEEHAAANAGEIELIPVVLASIEVRNAHKAGVGNANNVINTLGTLQALWNAP